jgi:hypothetical protein
MADVIEISLEGARIAVSDACPACGAPLTPGKVTLLGDDQVHFYGWMCPVHGEVPKPTYTFLAAEPKPSETKKKNARG